MVSETLVSVMFVATLSTAHNTHYVLTINNINKFKAFFYHELNSYADANTYEEAMKYSSSSQNAWELQEKYYSSKSALIKETNTNNEDVLINSSNLWKKLIWV